MVSIVKQLEKIHSQQCVSLFYRQTADRVIHFFNPVTGIDDNVRNRRFMKTEPFERRKNNENNEKKQ